MVKTILKEHAISSAAVAASFLTLVATSASAATVGPSVRLTARGNELARTTGLRRGDLPSPFHGGFVAGRPGVPACGAHRPPDDRLHVGGYASAAFAERDAHVYSKVTIYRDSATTDVAFARFRSSYTAACAADAAGSPGQLISATVLHVHVPLDHARVFAFILRRGGVYWTGRVYLLGEGRIAATLLVEHRGKRFTGSDTAQLSLSLLVSRMED